jgi:mono/diheme cytochrome c family protein
MLSNKVSRILVGAMVAIGVAAECWMGEAAAQSEPGALSKDYYQRSLEIYEFRKAAQRGPERGREIFYYKCWFCHNEFTKDIPKLTGLYQHPALLSGQPVNDDTVKEKIRNGGPAMAAYKYTLSDADLDDLVSYLREKCCWNSDSPPSNSRYPAR